MPPSDQKPAAGFDRRTFIRRTGAGAVLAGGAAISGVATAAQTAAGAQQPRAKTPGVDYDVIVVGGGFAGVTAARDARKAGYRTLLLEARDRLGGRTHTSEFAGHKVELGGTWIHWAQPYVWAEKERYGLEVQETPAEFAPAAAEGDEILVKVGDTVHRLSGEQILPLLQAFEAYFENARLLWDRPFDSRFQWNEILKQDKVSVRQRIDQLKLTPVQRVALESYVGSIVHGRLDQASHVDMLRIWSLAGWNLQGLNDTVVRYKLKDGTGALIRKIVEDGKPDVRLSTPVRRIEDQGARTVVTTAKGEQISAASVIVALPMNVLPQVEFSPPLDPALVAAAKEQHNGRGTKVFVKARGHYSKLARLTLMADDAHPLNMALVYATTAEHTIFVAFGGDPGKLDIRDAKAVERALKPFLPAIKVESCFGHDWAGDPYSRGTWATYKTGWFEKYHKHFEKDRGRVFFAQGDHGEGWRGCIDGAVGAGVRAAQRVRTKLG